MSTPSVTESPIRLEPVTADPFIADLAGLSAETQARLDALTRRAAALTDPHPAAEPPRPRVRRRLRVRIRPHVRAARPVIA